VARQREPDRAKHQKKSRRGGYESRVATLQMPRSAPYLFEFTNHPVCAAKERDLFYGWRSHPSFLRNFFLGWDQLHSKFLSLSRQTFENPFSILFFVSLLSDIDVVAPKPHQPVNQQGQFVGRRDDAFGLA